MLSMVKKSIDQLNNGLTLIVKLYNVNIRKEGLFFT
jgi:hypothetical protein